MPYIKPNLREKYESILEQFKTVIPETEGEFNYLLSSMLKASWDSSDKSYNVANSLVGILECVKLELYRRTITNYEEEKMKENGDI